MLSVLSFTDAADVVRQANHSVYGLQAGVWTRDINKAIGVARALKAGTVHVNQYDEDDITVPLAATNKVVSGATSPCMHLTNTPKPKPPGYASIHRWNPRC